MPPALTTASSHCCCSGFTRPLVLFTSMLVNTAICCPTISGVTVRVVQPIRSAEPLHNPNCTGLPLASRSVPVLLRNSRQLPLLHASRMCCWMVCSDGIRHGHRHPPFHISKSATCVHDLLFPDHAQAGAVVVHLETARRKVDGLLHAEQVSAIARRTKKRGLRPPL
jgi:hypothetical protein